MQTIQPVYSCFADDPDLNGMVTEFVNYLPTRIDVIRQTIAEGDLGELRCEARRLKGAGGCYGFAELADAASLLEKACDGAEDERRIARAATDLLEICDRIRAGADNEAELSE